jgi:hypothetical protein
MTVPHPDMARATAGAAVTAAAGIAQGGPGAVAFLADAVSVPLWFVIVPWILPTGEVLKVIRSVIRARMPEASDG